MKEDRSRSGDLREMKSIVKFTRSVPSYVIGGNQWDAPYALFLKTTFFFKPCSFTVDIVCEEIEVKNDIWEMMVKKYAMKVMSAEG